MTDEVKTERWSTKRILLVATTVALIVMVIVKLPESVAFVLRRTTQVVVTLILATALAYIVKPFVDLLDGLNLHCRGARLSRLSATLISFAVFAAFVLLGLCFVFDPIARDLKELAINLKEYKHLLPQWIDGMLRFYAQTIPDEFREVIDQQLVTVLNYLIDRATHGAWITFGWMQFIVEMLLVPVLAFYFLTDLEALKDESRLLVPKTWERRLSRLFSDIDGVINGYVRGQIILCGIATIVVTLGLAIVGMKFPITLGVFAGITRAIPIIGPIISGIPIVLLAMARLGVTTGSLVLLGFILLHALESKIIMPLVIGNEVDVHPVIIIIALLVGWEFFGILGMFVAAPVVAIIKVALRQILTHNDQGDKP